MDLSNLAVDVEPADVWSTWGILSEAERGFYMEFYAKVEGNQRIVPLDDAYLWSYRLFTPTEAQMNVVSDSGGYELCRTLSYRLTDGQKVAICNWIREHGSDHQIAMLRQGPAHL